MPQVIVNIPMPSQLKKAVDQLVAQGWYDSFSEAVREGTRRVVKSSPKLTVNGFTEEFEDEVLKAAEEPLDYSVELKSKADIDRYFDNLK